MVCFQSQTQENVRKWNEFTAHSYGPITTAEVAFCKCSDITTNGVQLPGQFGAADGT